MMFFVWDDASSALILNRNANDLAKNRGSLAFDLHARSADNDQIPLHFELQPLVLANSHRLNSENKAYRLIVSADAFSPLPLIIDPVYSGGNEVSTQGGDTYSASSHAVASVAVLLALLASVL